jgi:FkbM family methyltransferase
MLRRLPPPIAGRLRALRTRWQIATYRRRVVEHTYGARRLSVALTDPLAELWYDHDWPELPEIARLRDSRLRPGAVVFDAGAHQGVVAMMLAAEVGPTGLVVAVEPNPHNASTARTNRELNGLSRIEVVEAAVSRRQGRVTLSCELNGRMDDGSGIDGRMFVTAVTLDDLADRFGQPDVVFIDVEGAEGAALSGASRVLRGPTDFFVEVHAGCGLERLGGSVAETLSFFPRERFLTLARADEDTTFRPLDGQGPRTHARFFLLALQRGNPTPG